MKNITIYLTDKNIVTIGNKRIHLDSIFQIRALVRRFNKLGKNVGIVDFYQRIGQLFEHYVAKPIMVSIKGYSFPFSTLRDAQKFVRCYHAFKADCNRGGTEYCANSFFNYMDDYEVNTELIPDDHFIDSLKL